MRTGRFLALRAARLIGLSALAICTSCNVGDSPPPTLSVSASTPSSGAPVLIQPSPTPLNNTLPSDPEVNHLLDLIDSDRLLIPVDELSSMVTRHVLSAGFDPTRGSGIGAAHDYLISQFRHIQSAAPLIVWSQPVTVQLNGVVTTTYNVVAVLQGNDVNAGVIVIGAHYDSLNAADPFSADLPAPGADDNGSGVAAMLEIARLMASAPPRTTLIFVAFTAQETGLQGSAAFINAYLQAQQVPIVPRAVINLDTIGRNRTTDGQPAVPILRLFSADLNNSPSRQLARAIQLLASAYVDSPRAVVQSAGERTGRLGDQQSFSAAGYPAVRLIEGTEDMTRQRTAQDTFDTIQPGYLIGATKLALAAIACLSDGPDPPGSVHWQMSGQALTWSQVDQAAGYVVALRKAESVTFDRAITVAPRLQFIWSGLSAFDFAAVAAFNGNGRIGAFSPEVSLR